MKTYLKDLTPEEIIKRLKNGEFLQNPFGGYYKMVDGIICKFLPNGNTVIAECLSSQMNSDCYFETEEPFEIKEIGFYKTRDGKKAFVYYIANNDIKPIKGVIQGMNCIISWFLSGEYEQADKDDFDIISKWEDYYD